MTLIVDSLGHIVIENLNVEYTTETGKIYVIQDVNLRIESSEFITIIGPSGCGKSTLLNSIAGLVNYNSGRILIDGGLVKRPNPKKTAIVPQEASLFPWRTVIGNVEFGLEIQGANVEQRRKVAKDLISVVGLRGFEEKYPDQLSGGMKQRVSIARALSMDSPILLMDEPFGSLDEQTRLIMGEELVRIWQSTKKTIIFVTHSLQEAVNLSDRIVVMSSRPGKILEIFEDRIPRPREVVSDQANELKLKVWEILKREALKILNLV